MKLKKEEHNRVIDALRSYLETEFDLELGSVAADQFLTFLEQNVVDAYENQAIEEVRQLVEEKAWSMDEDIRALKGVKR